MRWPAGSRTSRLSVKQHPFVPWAKGKQQFPDSKWMLRPLRHGGYERIPNPKRATARWLRLGDDICAICSWERAHPLHH